MLVYKLRSLNYLTLSDLTNHNGLESFILSDGDHFEQFDHETYLQSETRGYFLKQLDLKNIVEEINDYIQSYRQSSAEFNDQKCAVHIVTTESAAGTLKVGLERPKMVIGFPDFFSIGPLWKLDKKVGQEFRNEWLFDNINFEQDEYVYQNKFVNAVREIEDIPKQSPIYIWYGNNANEQVGLRFFLYLLRNKENKIYLVNSTKLCEHYKHNPENFTGNIKPMDIRFIFDKKSESEPVSESERYLFQEEWEKLSQSKHVLRIWSNNEIREVEANHFDQLIIDTLEKLHHQQETRDFIKAGRLVGNILAEGHEGMSDLFLEYRIRHLIYSGVLELKGIPKSLRHYRVKLRK